MKSIRMILCATIAAMAVSAHAQTDQKSKASTIEDKVKAEDMNPMGGGPEIMPGHEPRPSAAKDASSAPATRELTAVSVEYHGTKIWLPSVFVVKRGERVRLKLINKISQSVHGFAIDEFGIRAEVSDKEEKVVEFTADKTGIFRSYCQLHPAHIGGQILVIE